MSKKVAFLQGNEAAALGGIYAGCNFFGGYPITPSTEVAEVMSIELPKIGGKFIQMEDEIGAMASILGAALAGSKAMTSTSGPGLSLKQELIGYGCIAEIPCVIFNVMRGGPSTGMPTGPSQSDVMCAKWGTHGDHPAICLAPASVQETYEEVIRAFNLSEKYRTPVMVMPDEIVAHMRERIVFPEPGEIEVMPRKSPTVPTRTSTSPMTPATAMCRRWPPSVPATSSTSPASTRCRTVSRPPRPRSSRPRKSVRSARSMPTWTISSSSKSTCSMTPKSWSLPTAPPPARPAMPSMSPAKQGIKAGMFRIKTFWPFPDKQIKALAEKVKGFIVPEMNLGMASIEVERNAQGKAPVLGIYRVDGEPINPDQILEKMKEVK